MSVDKTCGWSPDDLSQTGCDSQGVYSTHSFIRLSVAASLSSVSITSEDKHWELLAQLERDNIKEDVHRDMTKSSCENNHNNNTSDEFILPQFIHEVTTRWEMLRWLQVNQVLNQGGWLSGISHRLWSIWLETVWFSQWQNQWNGAEMSLLSQRSHVDTKIRRWRLHQLLCSAHAHHHHWQGI